MNYLEKLVGIRSDENCDQILEFIKDELSDKAVEVKIFGDDIKILIAGINTNLSNIAPIVLSGHIDTVKANEQLYRTNPYVLTESEGKAYGLGSIDMKSFTALILDNLQNIKELNVPIVLALTTDEETRLKSIEFMIQKFKELNITPKFTILGEPTNSQFNLSSNACLEYCVKFYGKACHSSKINEGINAICGCAKFISYIEERQSVYRLTSNCGIISGGEVVNKVPDYAELSFDIRSIYADDIDQFLQDLQGYKQRLRQEYPGLEIEIIKKLEIPAFNMLNNETIKTMANKLDIQIDSFTGGCEAGYYTSYSGDAIIYGVGDLSLAHKANEYVVVKEYYDYSQKLMSVMKLAEKMYYPEK